MYALIETGDGVPCAGNDTERGELWRSDDAGETWQVVSYDRNAMGRPHYYSQMFVAPDNENETYFLTAGYSVIARRRGNARPAVRAVVVRAATTTTCGSIRRTRSG